MYITDKLQLQFNSASDAAIFLESFLPEAHSMPMKRSQWTFSGPDASHIITIQITADDAIAYRATINALIQLAYLVEKTITIIDNFPESS